MEKKTKVSRGTATSFGFKKHVIASNPNNPTVLAPPCPEMLSSTNTQDINSPAQTGTSRLAQVKKESNDFNLRTMRFSFRPPPAMSNQVAVSKNSKANLRLEGLVKEETAKTHIPPPISQLPRPQFPMRLVAPAGYHSCTASSDKSAKTAANNHMARRSRFENGGSSASTVNDADSGVSSQRSINELELIKQRSPSARNRLRAQLPRSPFPVRLDARAGYHGRTASAKKSAKTAAMARRSRSANGGSPASSLEGLVKKEKHIPLISQLPRSSFPVRLVARAGYHGRTASAKKSATTAANNHMARHSRSANGGSPASSKSRPMEMISPRGNEKKLELRDLRGSKEVTEIMSLKLTPLSKRMVRGSMGNTPYHHNRLSSRDTGSSEDNEGIEDESGEEKLHRDGVLSEKDESGVVGAGDEPAEGGGEGVDDLWGHGEAMAGDKDLPNSGQESDPGCTMTPRLRSVLLSSEMNNLFAELAAVSTPVEGYNNLEDENYPEDFQFSATRTSTSPNESPRQEKQEKKSGASPVSEGGVREEDPPIASVTSSSA